MPSSQEQGNNCGKARWYFSKVKCLLHDKIKCLLRKKQAVISNGFRHIMITSGQYTNLCDSTYLCNCNVT